MPASFTAEKSIDLPVPPAKAWHALVTPDLITRYMFGAKVTGDWKKGGTVTYSGEWDGKPYADKGKIVEIDSPRTLAMDFYSAFSGLPDTPRELPAHHLRAGPNAGGTTLTITHANHATQDGATQAENNWGMTLDTMKTILSE